MPTKTERTKQAKSLPKNQDSLEQSSEASERLIAANEQDDNAPSNQAATNGKAAPTKRKPKMSFDEAHLLMLRAIEREKARGVYDDYL